MIVTFPNTWAIKELLAPDCVGQLQRALLFVRRFKIGACEQPGHRPMLQTYKQQNRYFLAMTQKNVCFIVTFQQHFSRPVALFSLEIVPQKAFVFCQDIAAIPAALCPLKPDILSHIMVLTITKLILCLNTTTLTAI